MIFPSLKLIRACLSENEALITCENSFEGQIKGWCIWMKSEIIKSLPMRWNLLLPAGIERNVLIILRDAPLGFNFMSTSVENCIIKLCLAMTVQRIESAKHCQGEHNLEATVSH
jgi:hypothetical protein